MGDYRVPNGGQYKSTSNGEIVLGIPDDLTEKRISEINDSGVPDTVPVVKEESSPQSTFYKDIAGFSLGIAASLLIAIGTGCIQALQGAVPLFQLTSLRAATQFFLASIFLLFKRKKPTLPKKKILWLLFYCIMILAFNVTNYSGVMYIAAGVAGSIRRSVNIIGITILATFLLKEQLTNPKIIGVILSLVGVIIMIQPWYNPPEKETAAENYGVTRSGSLLNQLYFMLHSKSQSTLHISSHKSSENVTEVTTLEPPSGDDSSDDWLGYLFSAAAGVAISFGTAAQKAKLSRIDPLTLNVWAGLSGAVVCVCVSAVAEDMRFPSETDDIIFVVVQSLAWGAAAIIAILAVSMTSPLIVTLAMAMQIVFLLIGQYTVLSDFQSGVGNWVEIFGAVLVVMSAMIPPAWQFVQVKLNPDCKKPSCGENEDNEPEYYDTPL